MIGPPLLLGAALEALESLERVAHLGLEVGAVLEALESLERAARLEAGAAPQAHGAVLASLERAVDLPRRGAPQVVHGALEKEERVEEDPARVARGLKAGVALERVAKDHGVLLPPPHPGAVLVLESQAKADHQDPAGMVMAGKQLQAGHQVQVESQAKVDHGIKPSS